MYPLVERIGAIMIVCSLAISLSACTGKEKDTTAAQGEPITPGKPIEPGTPITPGKPISISIDNPDVKVTPEKDRVTLQLPNKLLFDYDSDTLRPEAEKLLEQIGDELKKIGKANVEIQGYTDSQGSEQYNLALSDRRAKAVEHHLAAIAGLGGITLSTRGLGETNPAAPNDTEEHREQNRRVEIIIQPIIQ